MPKRLRGPLHGLWATYRRLIRRGASRKRGRPLKRDSKALTELQLRALQIYAVAHGRKALSAAQVARRLGVSRQAVAKWCRDSVWDERLGREITDLWTEELIALLEARDRLQAERREARRFVDHEMTTKNRKKD